MAFTGNSISRKSVLKKVGPEENRMLLEKIKMPSQVELRISKELTSRMKQAAEEA
jgi:hypothetical protein